jgi:hypothetical protein
LFNRNYSTNQIPFSPVVKAQYILYGTECWDVKNQHENKSSIAEIRILCLSGTHSRRVGVALTVKKRVETRLRLFELVERRVVDYIVRRVDQMEDNHIPRDKGRPIKT